MRKPSEDLSRKEPVPLETADHIRKLWWLGMQKEAEELQMTLLRVPHTDCVVVMPRDTD
jgi:hypothetical protein